MTKKQAEKIALGITGQLLDKGYYFKDFEETLDKLKTLIIQEVRRAPKSKRLSMGIKE